MLLAPMGVKHFMGMAPLEPGVPDSRMLVMKQVRPRFKKRRRTLLKEWREYRGLTQVDAASRLDVDQSTLSRIERSVYPYTQDFLETAAEAYGCSAADLLVRNPLNPDAIWSITEGLRTATPELQKQAKDVMAALLQKAS